MITNLWPINLPLEINLDNLEGGRLDLENLGELFIKKKHICVEIRTPRNEYGISTWDGDWYQLFCKDMIPYNGVTLKPIFHRVWIVLEESSVKWAPGLHFDIEIRPFAEYMITK